MSTAPKTCTLRVRRVVNKLTPVNVVGCARDLCSLFEDGSFPRYEVLTVLGKELVSAFCNTHVCTPAVLCAYSGLVRGLQLLHGSSSGTMVVSAVVDALRVSLYKSDDTAASNCGGFISSLYLVGGVGNQFIADLVHSCASEFADVGMSCCLTVLRSCGTKLVSEIPVELNKIIKGLEGQKQSKRGGMLLSVCRDMVRGGGGLEKNTAASLNDSVASSLLEIVGDKDKHTSRRRLATQNVSDIQWAASASPQEPTPEDERANKRKRIDDLRGQEKAVAGQRFASEAKREIFGCISSASDDVECFHALVNRDPSFAQLPDAFAVLLQCCVRESLPNGFYSNVIQRLVMSKKPFKNVLQYALWDRFKALRIDQADLTGFVNLSCLIGELLVADVFDLMLLRGLDLEETSKSVGLFTRVLILRLIVCLGSDKLTNLFFSLSCNRKTDDSLCRCLSAFVDRYFVDERESGRWMPVVFDVVANGTPFGDAKHLPLLVKRIEGVAKALKTRSV